MSSTTILFVFIILWFSVLVVVLISRLKSPSKENAIVVYGKIDPQNTKKYIIHSKGWIFIWPIIQKHYLLFLGQYKFKGEFTIKDLNEKLVPTTIEVSSNPDQNDLELVVSKNFKKNKEEIENLISKQIKEEAKATFNYKNLSKNMDKSQFRGLFNNVNLILKRNGFLESHTSNIFFKSAQ